MLGYEAKKQQLQHALAHARSAGGGVRLQKTTSNLFRHRQPAQSRIDVRAFNQVIAIDAERRTAEVEGMTTFEALVDATLRHGLLPPVAPQLKTITLGGAISGLGIESSSFRYGLVHETVEELEVLLGDGSTVICRPDNEHRDLFFGFPNSYGTLGYALRARIPLVPAKRYVELQHRKYTEVGQYFAGLARCCSEGRDAQAWDFIDGTVFGPGEQYITLGRMTDDAPYTSNYKGMQVYYRSLQRRERDYLTTRDYIWRWDTDWFWCSKHFGVQNPLVRAIAAPFGLRSSWYWKLMAFNGRYLEPLKRPFRAGYRESVIQDVEIPIDRCAEFLEFFHKELGIRPIWVCPIQPYDPAVRYGLYMMDPKVLYVNFGFWDFVCSDTAHPTGYFNRKVEAVVAQLGGRKSLYSSSFYSEDEFWSLYNKPVYDALKAKYDPQGVFRGLYEKCVGRS